MTQEMKYENWFLIHSGMKKPVNPTKGGFLSAVQASLSKAASEIIETIKPKEIKKEEKKVEIGLTPYEKWFYRNCDNNNVPDLSEIKSHDYESWFLRHSTKRAPELKYSSQYEAWFFRNCDNRNIPDLSKIKSHDYESWFLRHSTKGAPEPKYTSQYEAWFFRNCDNRNIPDLTKVNELDYPTWFKKHSIKRAPCTCDNSYDAWFERNCDNKNPGVMPIPTLTYELWFDKHCTPSESFKTQSVKHEPYDDWFKKHSK